MRFTELCTKVLAVFDQYAAQNGITVDQDYAILKLVEEIGEFAQAVIIQRGMCRTEKRLSAPKAQAAVANELSDILGLTILVADRIGVDLQSAVRDKWLHFLDDPQRRKPPVRGKARRVRPRPRRGSKTRS